MGLAASQARLLSITRRISDNELRAQLINNQKMRLATESSKVSENYINALNTTNLMFTNYGANNAQQTIPLTYNALTAYNQYNNQYVLSDVAGSVFLREDMAAKYIQNVGNLEGFLNANGIYYTTTYWDTVGSALPDEELATAAVVRAWYETQGIDGAAGIEGIEDCSIFPTLEELAQKIAVTADNIQTDSQLRSQLIQNAVNEIKETGYANKWFRPHEGDDWLTLPNNNGVPTADFSLYCCHDWFLKHLFTAGDTTQSANLKAEFDNIYTALWNYGNGNALGVDVSSLPEKWQTRLEGYQPIETLNLSTFFAGCSGAPTNYLVGSDENTNSMYYESGHWEDMGNGQVWEVDEKFVKLPGSDGQAHWTLMDNNSAISYETMNIDGNNYAYIKYVDGDNVYHIPHNQNNSSLPIYKGSPSSVTNPEDLRSQANTWIKEAIKDYINKQLHLGERIQTDDQMDEFRGMGFSDYQIDIINNAVDYSNLNELKKEFFNVFLGSPNHANNDWGTPKYVFGDSWRSRGLVRTVNWIVDGLNNLEYRDLTSKKFAQLGIDTNYDALRDLFTNGYNGNSNANTTAEDVLQQVWADVYSSNSPINNIGWLGNNLGVYFHNFSQVGGTEGETVNTWGSNENGDPLWQFYGQLEQGYTGVGHSLHDDGRLLMEFVYPAAFEFFNAHGAPVYGYMKQNGAGEWEDATAEAEWYTNLFNKVEKNGYKTLEKGLASSEDWIRFALENGVAIVEQLNTVDTWNKITYSSCSDITEETNSRVATLAEAEYNKAMNQIQSKDERLDLELKNIDTEHTSLQQEYESVKKAMGDHVTRTFKLYS